MWAIEIPALPPRPGRDHHMKVYREKKKWTTAIGWRAKELGIPEAEPHQHRRVHITFHHPGVKMDDDNRGASCKVPLDALVRADLLHDDAPAYCTLTHNCVSVGRGGTMTVIHLSDE